MQPGLGDGAGVAVGTGVGVAVGTGVGVGIGTDATWREAAAGASGASGVTPGVLDEPAPPHEASSTAVVSANPMRDNDLFMSAFPQAS